MSEFKEGECLPKPDCGCIGHHFPNVQHIAPCCDTPHITEEEFEGRIDKTLKDIRGDTT